MINHIIISLQRTAASKAVAYHYCDFSNPLSLDPCEIVGCLLRQLALQAGKIPSAIQNLYHKCSGQRPQLTMLCEVLEALIEQAFETTYLVIDGLDESPSRQVLLDEIRQLGKAADTTNRLRILVASRPEYDIRQALSEVPSFSIEHRHVERDMETHVRAELAKMPKLRAMPIHAQEGLIMSLVKRSEGMFRWIQCQLDTLRKLRTPQAINQALQALPAGLDETYDRILSSLDEGDHEYVLRMLHWLVDSERPFSVTELAEAIALNPNKDRLDPAERLIVPEEVFELCGSLVRVDEDEIIVLAHFSVKEYLLSGDLDAKEQRLAKFALRSQDSRRHVSMCILSYVVSIGLRARSLQDEALDEDEFPLMSYTRMVKVSRFQDFDAVRPWMERHVFPHGDEDHDWLSLLDYVEASTLQLSNTFVVRDMQVFLQCSLMCFWNGHVAQRSGVAEGSNVSRSVERVASVFLRLQRAFEHPENADKVSRCYGCASSTTSPLCSAAAYNFEHVARFLLDNGALVDGIPSLQFLGNPLVQAIRGGNKDIVRVLTDYGADINVRTPRLPGITPFTGAAVHSPELVKHLLQEYDIDTNAVVACGRTIVSDSTSSLRQTSVIFLSSTDFAALLGYP